VRKFRSVSVLAVLVLVVSCVAAWAVKEAIRDEAGEIIGYRETTQDGNKTTVTEYGPDGETVLKVKTTEIEERDDGTIVTTVIELVTDIEPDGTKKITETTTVIEEFPTGPIAKRIIETVVSIGEDEEGVQTRSSPRQKITLIDRWGRIQGYQPTEGFDRRIPRDPTPTGER